MNELECNSEILTIEQHTADGYTQIEPERLMSPAEINDYINEELALFQNVDSTDAVDSLSCIFGIHEDNVEFEYFPSNEVISTLKKFTTDAWVHMDQSEKMTCIDELVASISKDLDLNDKPYVVISDSIESHGAYVSEDNVIIISSKDINDPKEIVNTIAHEMRHAYQHERADIGETTEDVLYKLNFDNYIQPDFFYDYYNQYVEVEARVFADKIEETM